MQTMFRFERPLKEGRIIKRANRFMMDVELDGQAVKCHCPTTGRIGDIEVSGVACLVSESDDPKRKLKYTVEAISCDDLEVADKNWVGINQVLSNKLVAHLLKTHQLDDMISDYADIQREVSLGISKLDFLVGNTYIEVKTGLTTLNVNYGKHIAVKPAKPFSSTERFTKHINELAGSLKEHERAILLTVNQYVVTNPKPRQRSTHFEEVSAAMRNAKSKGLETWNLSLRFTPEGVALHKYENTTDKE